MRWHRRVLTLALPIVLANLTQPILGAVDTAVAGHLDGPQYLGGVALGGLVFSFVFWGFGFLRMGTTGLVAQAFGARDAVALRASLLRALMLALAIGVAVLVLQAPIVRYALVALGGSAAVQQTASTYCHARIWAAPFALANYVVLGYLLGCQRVRLALVVQVFINAMNVVAVLLSVYRFGWGIAGIGAATAFADFCGFALGVALLWRLRERGLAPLGVRALLTGMRSGGSSRSTATSSSGRCVCSARSAGSRIWARVRAMPCSPRTRCCSTSRRSRPTDLTASRMPPKRSSARLPARATVTRSVRPSR